MTTTPDPTRRRFLLGSTAGMAALALAGATGCEPYPPRTPVASRSLPAGAGNGLAIAKGAWCVWPRQRALIHPDGRLFVGYLTGRSPLGGTLRATSVDLTRLQVLEHFELGRVDDLHADDHWSPGLALVGGKVASAWTLHTNDAWLSVSPSLREPHRRVDLPGKATYAQLHHLWGRRLLTYRGGLPFGWALAASADGRVWESLGTIVTKQPIEGAPPQAGGHRPYLCLTPDRSGQRLWFAAADSHAGESGMASVFVGAIEADLTITDADGLPVGRVGEAPVTQLDGALTRLLAGQRGADDLGHRTYRAVDLSTHDDGTVQVLITGREPVGPYVGPPPRGLYWHRYWCARRDPATGAWDVQPLAWAGAELAAHTIDYVGLLATDPTTPDRVVVSSNVHPATGAPAVGERWQLWEGVRAGGGWVWAPLTADPSRDNIRPVLVASHDRKALVWMRGRYRGYVYSQWNTEICARRA